MSNNNKKVWHEVFFSQLPTSEADPDATFEFDLGNFHARRCITIVPLGHGIYTGDILKGHRVTGEWRWNTRKDIGVIVKSYLRVNDRGQAKRYAGGHVACEKIEEAVTDWLSRKRGSFSYAEEQVAA